jgi:hypothetical protein
MNKNNSPRLSLRHCLAISLVAVLGLFAVGCTHTAKVRVQSTARIMDPAAAKIPLHVALMLEDRFCTYSSVSSMGPGDTFVYPLGPALRQSAVSLCEQSFQRVTISTNEVVPAGVDAVLTPELYRTGFARTSRVHLRFTILVQWTLREPENRNVLWMTTVDGQGADVEKRVFQLLCDDLTAKSYRAFQNSPEIRRISAKAK